MKLPKPPSYLHFSAQAWSVAEVLRIADALGM
jgi:hypothetical protein